MSSSSFLHAHAHVLLLLFLLIFDDAGCFLHGASGRRVSSLRMERVRRHLEKINKPAVLTLESPDGDDIIDCVHLHKQPALDHPLLRNHTIQREPPQRPRHSSRDKDNKGRSPGNYAGDVEFIPARVQQAWHAAGHCPEGTVPIRRSSADDVLRARSIYHYGKKHHRYNNHNHNHMLTLATTTGGILPAPDVVSGNGHEHAIAYTSGSSPQELYGAKATINVWEPKIESPNEFSLSQIWILAGTFNGSDLNSIEAGWQVNPELYGDNKPRLFTYWTNDAYKQTGCYNLLCSGFVQTNNKIAIGAAITPVSSSSNNQLFEMTMLIWKDPRLGNWWLSYNDGALVGYWPAELFTHLADRATMVEWGGEVVNTRPNGAHTATQMGSGSFAEAGFGRASYFRDVEVVDSDNSLSSAAAISTLAENRDCYDIRSSSNPDWGVHFFYGGPGNGPKCP